MPGCFGDSKNHRRYPRTSSATTVNRRRNAKGRSLRVLALPYTQGQPTRLSKSSIGIAVALSVPFELVPPPLCIRLRPSGVFWTSVPKAAIDEDGNSSPGKDDISLPADFLDRPPMHEISQTSLVKSPAQFHLARRVAHALRCHAGADRLT